MFSDLKQLALLTIIGPAALIIGAIGFQIFADLPPCDLCMDQRYAHGVGIAGGVLAFIFATRQPKIALLCLAIAAIGIAASAGIGGYHAGVEYGWWTGPQTCSGVGESAKSAEDMLRAIEDAPLASCDETLWSLFGVSLAGYNFLISAALAGLVVWKAKDHVKV